MNKKKIMSPEERLEYIAGWIKWFYVRTESWSDPLGRQLAYLFAAMINNNYIALSEKSALISLLRREEIGSNDEIWSYIKIV